MSAATMTPYLFFGGRCEEAIDFYSQALGAKLVMKMLYNQSPDPVPEGMLPPGFENKVMHASLQIGPMTLMMSDGREDRLKFAGFSLAIQTPSEEEAQWFFNGLANGGQIEMPLMKTFWSPCYGMVTDQFGICWMVMVPGQPS